MDEFTDWLADNSVESNYIFKWLDKWDKIPSIVYQTISSRNDLMIYFQHPKISNDPKEFFRCIKYQLKSNYLFSFGSLIKEKIQDPSFDLQFQLFYNEIKSKGINEKYSITFYRNFFQLLEDLEKKDELVQLFSLLIFQNKYKVSEKVLVDLVDKTIHLVFSFLEKGIFYHNSNNLLEKTLDLLLDIEYKKYHSQLFVNVFNQYSDKMNIYNKELILSYLFMCLVENEHSIKYLLNIHLDELYTIYYKTLDVGIKLIILQIFLIIDQLNIDKKCLDHPTFIYKFLKDFNDLLDDYFVQAKILEPLLASTNPFNEYQIIYFKTAQKHILNTMGYLEVLEKVSNVNNEILNISFIRKYLTNFMIVHLDKFEKNRGRYLNVEEYIQEYDLKKYTQVFLGMYLYYGKSPSVVQQIVDDMSREQYRGFIQLIKDREGFEFYQQAIKKNIEYPLEFLDAISMEPLKDIIELPDSKILVNRETIQIHYLDHSTDPFTRKECTLESIFEYNEQKEVKKRIQSMKEKIEGYIENYLEK